MKKILDYVPYLSRPSTQAAATEQPPAPPPKARTRKTSALPGALRELMDQVTARPKIKAARQLSNDHLTTLLDRDDLRGGRNIRAMQREARKRNLPPLHQSAPETPVQRPAPSQAALSIAPPNGPVIDPDTGALDTARLRQTVSALSDALPAVPDHIAPRHQKTGNQLRNRLMEELSAIDTLAADNPSLRPDQLGLAVRDQFAKASRTASVLARYLDRQLVAGNGARPDAASYFMIAGLLTELKRTHLSAAAHDIGNEYAQREVQNLERAAPGISQGISGPNVATTTSVNLAYAPLHAHSALTVQAGVSGGATLFADDDRDIDFWTSYGVSLKAGIGGTFRKLSNWAGQTSGQVSYSGGGTYFEHDDLHELVKLIANLDANRSWIRSAGPKTRRLVHNMEQLRNDIARFVGRNYTPAAGRPYYLNDGKIAKGFNAFKMSLLSMALDQHLGHDHFGKLIAAAYPSAGDVLRQRLAEQDPLPAAPRRDVPDSVAYADRLVAFRETTVSGDANLSKATGGSTDLEAAGTFDANLRGDLMQFFTETTNPPHQLLDPGYHKDFKATFDLHRQLDALCGTPAPPQLHLYDTMRRGLSAAGADAQTPLISAHEQLLFGDAASVPAQFLHAIGQPGPQPLERAAAHAEILTGMYRSFIDDSQALLARNDRFMPPEQRAELRAARAEAFARINDEIWGGRYPHSEAKALANPKEFIGRSYGNISLALGCVGTHIAILKQQSTREADPGQASAIEHADSRYNTVRTLLDRLYLPLKKYDVQKNGPLKDAAIWERWDAALKLQASGGAQSNTLGAILGRAKKSLGPVSITNDAGEVTASAEIKVMKATRQVNPGRLGTFWQITLTAQGGAPLLGSMLEKAVRKAVERLNASLATDTPKIDPADALRQVQGLALDVSDGSSIVMKFRQAPGLSPRATDLQYIRVLGNKSSGLAVSVSLPTHAGTFTPALSYADSSQGFEGEIIGPDLSYLMMQHPKLAAVLDQAPGGDPRELKQLFNANPHVRNAYFGHPQTIVDVVSRYADYLQAKDAAAARGQSLESAPMVNEFQRYYASEPFARVAQIAREVASHAPGTAADGAAPVESQLPLSTDIEIGDVDLDAARSRLQTLGTLEQRVDYFCGEGRALLDTFAAIVSNTRAINSAALFHVEPRNMGIQTRLRDEATLRRQ
ncbi:type III effector protein [Paraburkholderia phenazinium]|uniref:type III effector protein n=1 Tax=Paraburkholderia phenazinium TaxID=60549 RepID=UPI00158CD646|nr:type III effector protein [Paraburkholderia phenazinium]